MRRTISLGLFVLGCLIIVQATSGILLHTTRSFDSVPHESNQSTLRLHLPYTAPGCMRVWQSGKELSGPYRFLKEIEDLGSGTFAVKERNLYVVPLSHSAEETNLDFQVQVSQPVPRVLTALALIFC